MKNAIIIHGTYGNPDENWFPWLKGELEKIGYHVDIPSFPTPDNQNFGSWMDVFSDYGKKLNSDSIIIGHSLGAAFILAIIELLDYPVKAVFLVSGFLGLLGNDEFDELNKDFVVRKFDWDKIKRNANGIYIYHSDNDPYVPLDKAYDLAGNLGVEPNVIGGAGHFNEKSGYIKFPQLLERIKGLDN